MKPLMRYISNFYNHRKCICLVTFAVIMAVISLSPMLKSGYISDDSLNSLTKGYLLDTHQTLPEMTYYHINAWVHNEGRFFPLAWYGYSLFSVIDNLFLYKISILIVVIINILIFGYFIKTVTNSWSVTLLSILLPPLFFQYRLYHDPILSFSWLQQIVFLYTFVSLILLVYYLQNGKRFFLILSSFVYLLSLLTYEITYPFFIFHFLIIYFYGTSKKYIDNVIILLPFILLSFLSAMVSMSLRVYCGIPLSGGTSTYVPNFEIKTYFITLMKQTYAAFPLSYFSVDPDLIFQTSFDYLTNYLSIWHILIGVGYFSLFFLALNNLNLKKLDEKCIRGLLFLGFSLLILPGALMSLSPKYQNELSWGIGYLPVYHSYFGLAMILIAIVYMAYNKITNVKFKLILSVLIAIILCTTVVINYNNNNISVDNQNSFWLYPRTIIEDALKNGLFMNASNDSYLLINSNNPWDRSAFFHMDSNVKLENVGVKGQYKLDSLPVDALRSKFYDKYYLYDFSGCKKVFFLSYDSFSNENGYAILGKITDLQATEEKLIEVNSEEIYLYVRTPYFSPLKSHEKITVYGQWINKNKSELYEPFSLEESQLKLVNSGLNWKLFFLETSSDTLIDLQSLKVNIVPRTTLSSTHWRPKNESELILKTSDNVLLHVGFKKGIISDDVSFDPLSLSNVFTVEVILKPFENQVVHAGIMGNHPGYQGYEGFVIQQDNQNQNVYSFGFGNGTEWLPGVKFKLNEEKWNYLVVVVEKNIIKVFNNGMLVASIDAKGSIKNSETPLEIGNWINRDRPFNGLIEEVRISNGSISENEIVVNWQEIEVKLGKLD